VGGYNLGLGWSDIVLLDIVAVEALDVEQSSVKKFELFSWVICSLREACCRISMKSEERRWIY
jgi:hypothetical protein